jgi:hypothetical protein
LFIGEIKKGTVKAVPFFIIKNTGLCKGCASSKGDDLMSFNILIPIIIMGLIILCGFGIFKIAKIMKR